MADYKYAFDYGVYDVTNMGDPQPINVPDNGLRGGEFGLSASNNSFQLLSAGRFGGSLVEGVLFTYKPAASAAMAPHTDLHDRFSLMSPGHGAGNTAATAQISITSNGSNMINPTDSPKLLLTDEGGTALTFTGVLTGAEYPTYTFNISAVGEGANYYIMRDLVHCINYARDNHSLDMTATLHHLHSKASLVQGSVGGAGNTTITVATPVTGVKIDRNFSGGHTEEGDPTIVLAAGGASGYHATSAAVVCADGNTVLYCFEHSSTSGVKGSLGPIISGFNLATGPNIRRLTALGYR